MDKFNFSEDFLREIDRLQNEDLLRTINGKLVTAFANNQDVIISTWKFSGKEIDCEVAFRLSVDSAKTLLLTLQSAILSAQNIDGPKLN